MLLEHALNKHSCLNLVGSWKFPFESWTTNQCRDVGRVYQKHGRIRGNASVFAEINNVLLINV